jgi:hypothetical protein
MNDDRITITIDTPEMPNNDIVAARTLTKLIRYLQHHGIYPTHIRLEIDTAPPTF